MMIKLCARVVLFRLRITNYAVNYIYENRVGDAIRHSYGYLKTKYSALQTRRKGFPVYIQHELHFLFFNVPNEKRCFGRSISSLR